MSSEAVFPPDPRDYEERNDYLAAVTAYLAQLQRQTGEKSPMDAIRHWRDNPPEDGWES